MQEFNALLTNMSFLSFSIKNSGEFYAASKPITISTAMLYQRSMD